MNRRRLIILDLFVVKVSTPMIIWIVLIDLKILNCHPKMRSSANCLVVHAQIQSIHMRLECGMPLDVRRWQITTISICSRMCFFYQIFSKSSVELVWNSIVFIHYIHYTTPGLAWDAALRMSRVALQLVICRKLYSWRDLQ